MLGNNVLTCIHSEWNGNKPVCLGLNQENDYASMYSLHNKFVHNSLAMSGKNIFSKANIFSLRLFLFEKN